MCRPGNRAGALGFGDEACHGGAPMPATLPPIQPSVSMRAQALRWVLLAGLSLAASAGLIALRLPAATLLGPMAAATALAVLGRGVSLPGQAMTFAQGILGLLIAGLLPPEMLGELLARWPVVLAGTLSTLILAGLLGWALARSGILPGTTAIWGSAPGAASVMTLLSADYGADMRLVAFMQYLRVACVALAAALVAHGFGLHAGAAGTDWFPRVPATGLMASVALAAALAFGGQAIGFRGGSFLLAMAGGVALVRAGFDPVLPPWLLAGTYAAVGWTIGLRFTPAIIAHAARAFPRVLGSILLLIGLSGLGALALVRFAGVDPLTAYLATSPGGADSVAIIASQTKVDVPFVMTMQMARFLLIVAVGPWAARVLSSLAARGQAASR